MTTRTRYQNTILALLAAIALVFGGLLFYNRTQPGVMFREAFLKRQVTPEYTVYYGACKGEETAIYVTPKTDGTLVQILAGAHRWEYIVSVWEGASHDRAYQNDTPVVITDVGGKELFRGYLAPNGYLIDEEGHLDPDFGIFVYTEYGNKNVWDDYEPSKLFVTKLALEPEPAYHGSIGMYLLMLFAAFCVAVDILFPEFYFQLKYMFSVRDPEPSDFYIAMQRLGWAIWPVLLAIGFGYAATMLP